MDANKVINTIGQLVLWGIGITVGITVFLTLCSGILAFASTGIGAIILALIAFYLWKRYNEGRND